MKHNTDELDLLKVSSIIWKKKSAIFMFVASITILTLLTFNLIEKEPDKVFTSSEVKQITAYEESKYILWNSFLENIKIEFITDNYSNDLNQKNQNLNTFHTLSNYPSINRQVLYDLFNERLSQRDYIENTLKEFNFLNKQNFLNDDEYQNAINELKKNINIYIKKKNQNRSTLIEFETAEPLRWNNYLRFLEQDINASIREDLIDIFKNDMVYKKKILNYAIEDLQYQISNTFDENRKLYLENKLKNLFDNKYDERLLEALSKAPFIDNKKFHAAKIYFTDIEANLTNSTNKLITLLLSVIIISFIIAVFYVILMDTVKNRK